MHSSQKPKGTGRSLILILALAVSSATHAFNDGEFELNAQLASAPTPQIFVVGGSVQSGVIRFNSGIKMMAPAALHVAAIPDLSSVAHRCGTVHGVDVATASTALFEQYMTATQRQQVFACLRTRDLEYEAKVAKEILGNTRLHQADFKWDFGDPASPFNVVQGFNAAHIYDKAGTYTVTLTIRNEANISSSMQAKVTVNADTRKNIYATWQHTYASAASVPTNVPAGKGKLPFSAATCQNDVNIFLRRGDTFTRDDAAAIKACANVRVGVFGSGSKPAILESAVTTTSPVIPIPSNGTELVFEDLGFQTAAGKNLSPELQNSGTLVTLRRSTFASGTQQQGNAVGGAGSIRGLLLLGNGTPKPATGTWPLTQIRGNFVYMIGSDVAAYGNHLHFVEATGEPTFRSCGALNQRIALVGNHIFSDVTNKHNPVALRNGHFMYIGHNRITPGQLQIGGGCAPGHRPNEGVGNTVIDSNLLENVYIRANAGTRHTRIVNNLFDDRPVTDTEYPMPLAQKISVYAPANEFPATEDVSVVNNTWVSERPGGNFLVISSTLPASVDFVNNLLYMPLSDFKDSSSTPIIASNNASATQFPVFRRADSNVFVGKLSAISASNRMVAIEGGYASADQWMSSTVNGSRKNSDHLADSAKTANALVKDSITYSVGLPAQSFAPGAGADFGGWGMNLIAQALRSPDSVEQSMYSVVSDQAGKTRSPSAASWTPGARQ